MGLQFAKPDWNFEVPVSAFGGCRPSQLVGWEHGIVTSSVNCSDCLTEDLLL